MPEQGLLVLVQDMPHSSTEQSTAGGNLLERIASIDSSLGSGSQTRIYPSPPPTLHPSGASGHPNGTSYLLWADTKGSFNLFFLGIRLCNKIAAKL
jgi:hypothetical protein